MLDVPEWSYNLREAMFDGLTQFEDFLISCENILQHLLINHDYNTFNSFIEFYKDFKCGSKANKSVMEFISQYRTNIYKESLSCVGLSLLLIGSLRNAHPNYGHSITLVSCEEVVKDTGGYSMESPNNVKEHVLVCIRVCIENRRYGYVLLDAGYHISRTIVVMNDMLYPHTGWFVQSTNPLVTKEYCYQLINDKFIAWKVREMRNGSMNEWANLIYVQRAFAKCLSITEKRSLIYSLKSLVIRNRKGPIAGIYCWIKSKTITIFYDDNGKRVQQKLAFDQIGTNAMNKALSSIAPYIKSDSRFKSTSSLHKMLIEFREAVSNSEFMNQITEIDNWIETE